MNSDCSLSKVRWFGEKGKMKMKNGRCRKLNVSQFGGRGKFDVAETIHSTQNVSKLPFETTKTECRKVQTLSTFTSPHLPHCSSKWLLVLCLTMPYLYASYSYAL